MPRARAPGRVAGYLEEGGEERELVDGAGHRRGAEETRTTGRRGCGVGRGEGGVAASGRRGGDEDDGAASRRRGSGVGRGEGKGIEGEGEGERGDRLSNRYIHTNGAHHPGAL